MQTLFKPGKCISRRVITGLLIFSLIMPPSGLLPQPAYAQDDAAGGLSRDPQRIAKYISKIDILFVSLMNTLTSADDASRYYLRPRPIRFQQLPPKIAEPVNRILRELDSNVQRVLADANSKRAATAAKLEELKAACPVMEMPAVSLIGGVKVDIEHSGLTLYYTGLLNSKSPYPKGGAEKWAAYAQLLRQADNPDIVPLYLVAYRQLQREITGYLKTGEMDSEKYFAAKAIYVAVRDAIFSGSAIDLTLVQQRNLNNYRRLARFFDRVANVCNTLYTKYTQQNQNWVYHFEPNTNEPDPKIKYPCYLGLKNTLDPKSTLSDREFIEKFKRYLYPLYMEGKMTSYERIGWMTYSMTQKITEKHLYNSTGSLRPPFQLVSLSYDIGAATIDINNHMTVDSPYYYYQQDWDGKWYLEPFNFFVPLYQRTHAYWEYSEPDEGYFSGQLPIRGNYDLTKVNEEFTEGVNLLYCGFFDAELNNGVIRQSFATGMTVQTLINKHVDVYRKINNLYLAYKSAQENLAAAVNEFNHPDGGLEIVTRTSDECPSFREPVVDYDFRYELTGFTTRSIPLDDNAGTVTDFTVTTEVSKGDMEHGYSISARVEPATSGLAYKWRIKEIPDTQNAHSNYILDQEMSSIANFNFKPDLAGEWKLEVDVSDGKQSKTAQVNVNAVRRILWIQHKNAPYDDKAGLGISLEPNNPPSITGADGKLVSPEGSYYLETAHLKAGVYLNYEDNGIPVDIDTSYVPADQSSQGCFKLDVGEAGSSSEGKKSNYVIGKVYSPGYYNGEHGSTHLPETYIVRGGEETFELKAAPVFPRNGRVEVEVKDPTITELVLPDVNGKPLRQVTLKVGYFKIEQFVDYKHWVNLDGEGFKEVDGSSPILSLPDWLEKRAAEWLNATLPEILPYVKRIQNIKPEMHCADGYYELGAREIHLNPDYLHFRWNVPSNSIYGFFSQSAIDAFARHEAYHAFYYWTVAHKSQGKSQYQDADGDEFPGVRGGVFKSYRDKNNAIVEIPIFEYLFDSETEGPGGNRYGACGYTPEYNKYMGDMAKSRKDGVADKILIFEHAFNARDITPREINLKLPIGIPYVDKQNKISNGSEVEEKLEIDLFFKNNKGKVEYIYGLYEFDLRYQKSINPQNPPQVKISILDSRVCDFRIMLDYFKKRGYDVTKLYIKCHLRYPHPVFEYETSRIEPGVYTGVFSW